MNDLIDSINFYPDQMTVQVVGDPPIKVDLKEGLVAGINSVVSETRRNVSSTAHWQLDLSELWVVPEE